MSRVKQSRVRAWPPSPARARTFTWRDAGRAFAALVCCPLLVTACGQTRSADPSPPQPSATTSGDAATALGADGRVVLPPERSVESNPLGLPAASFEVNKGARVFAVLPESLASAGWGRALVLRAATVVGADGGNLLVRVGHGRAYTVHPGYVVSLAAGRKGRGTPIVAAYRGRLRHGVVKNVRRDRVVVRYTDIGRKIPDQKLAPDKVGVIRPGRLQAGGRAVYRADDALWHVLLVSVADYADGHRRWLVLGHHGVARKVDARRLRALPLDRLRLRVGAPLLVASQGRMVAAVLRSRDRPGWFTVQRPRLARPLLVGPGMVMPASASARP